MRQRFALSIIISTVALSHTAWAQPIESRITAKPAESFAQCFVSAQDGASEPWSFVPREGGGGTFSNLGAQGAPHPYFLDVADRGNVREIRLTSAAANRSVLRAVDRCI